MKQQKNVVINVGTSAALAEVVQNLLLKSGYKWLNRGVTYSRPMPFGYTTLGLDNGVIVWGAAGDFYLIRRSYGAREFNAATQFGELVAFLEQPVEIRVKLNDQYTAVVGKTHTVVGDVTVPNSTILAVAKEIESRK